MEKAKSGWLEAARCICSVWWRKGWSGPRLQGWSERCPKGVDLDRVARYRFLYHGLILLNVNLYTVTKFKRIFPMAS